MFELIRQTFLNLITFGAYNLYRTEKMIDLNDKKQKERQIKYMEQHKIEINKMNKKIDLKNSLG